MKINYKIQNMQLAGLLHDHRYVYSIEVILPVLASVLHVSIRNRIP